MKVTLKTIDLLERAKIPSEKILEIIKILLQDGAELGDYVESVPARMHSKAWAKIRVQIIERDGPLCAYCGETAIPIHIDHIYPLSRGGSNDLENLTVACAQCNIEKSDHTLEELGWE